MLRKSFTIVFLLTCFISNAIGRRNSDSDLGHESDDFEDGDRTPFLADDEDMQVKHESNPALLGPFNITLEAGAISLGLSWAILSEDESSNDLTDIEFKLFTNASKINWVAFGFTENKQFNEADWFVAWKSHKSRFIYTKDCNSMKGVLHYDMRQDYDVISSRRLHSFNLTVRRALDTGDIYDVVLEKGKPVTLVWAYGMANTFSKIKHEIKGSWKSKEFFLFGNRRKEASNNAGRTDETTDKAVKNPKGNPSEGEIGNIENEEKGEKNIPTRRSHITATAFNKVEGRSRANHKSENTKFTMLDGTQHYAKETEKIQTESARSHGMSTSGTTSPCTVVVKYTKRWRDYFKIKERSVYYAILGSSAIMTGILVIMLACCCRKKSPDPRRSKVSFYKVDDYDDEQIEFLKEKA